jgi:hypothetical protein
VLTFCFIQCVIGLNVFEIVMLTGLLKHLTDRDIVSKVQYGVRIKLQTDSATYQLTNEMPNVYKSSLTNRYHRTVLYNQNGNITTSSCAKTEHVVLQGSVLGPLVFIIPTHQQSPVQSSRFQSSPDQTDKDYSSNSVATF